VHGISGCDRSTLRSILDKNHSTSWSATVDPAIEELNHIVDQAESLLRSLGEQGGEAAEAVRGRVTQTLNQAKARLADVAVDAEQVAESLADRADEYVRTNPWQAVAMAALLGGVAALLITKSTRRP
jgi:ElaB/YqjD/DUF883 family membrane-anchored ribosome-binding protein